MRICVKIHLVFDTMADDHKPQVHNPANNEDNKHDHFHTETFHICHRTESSLRTHVRVSWIRCLDYLWLSMEKAQILTFHFPSGISRNSHPLFFFSSL